MFTSKVTELCVICWKISLEPVLASKMNLLSFTVLVLGMNDTQIFKIVTQNYIKLYKLMVISGLWQSIHMKTSKCEFDAFCTSKCNGQLLKL